MTQRVFKVECSGDTVVYYTDESFSNMNELDSYLSENDLHPEDFYPVSYWFAFKDKEDFYKSQKLVQQGVYNV